MGFSVLIEKAKASISNNAQRNLNPMLESIKNSFRSMIGGSSVATVRPSISEEIKEIEGLKITLTDNHN